MFSAIGTGDLKGLRNTVGTLCLYDREAVFFTRKWGRLVARRTAPLHSSETRKKFLLDKLVLVTGEGRRVRFDLLAGQLDRTSEETGREASSPPLQSLN
jgi:hypothetical protein